MDTFELAELTFSRHGQNHCLTFSAAKLVVVEQTGTRLWYIDVNGVDQEELLQEFNTSEDIRIDLAAITIGGRTFSGVGYLHPNVTHQAAAIRGDGELAGY